MTDEAMSPLRRRMIEDMTIRKLAPKTQQGYIRTVKDFAAFLGRSPDTASLEDVRRFQLHLAENGAHTSFLNQTVSALRFFFRVTLGRHDIVAHTTFIHEPRKLPVVLSLEEVARLLNAASGLKYKAALSVAYGAGLRAAEVISLKVSDIDSKRMIIRVEQGKGRKDRYVMLSPSLLELLRAWWRAARPQGWLFPGRNPVQPMTTRQLNRACHAAAQAAGIEKNVSLHTLRHSFATQSARAEHRYSSHPGSARSRQAREHGALYAGCHQDDPASDESAGTYRAEAQGGSTAQLKCGGGVASGLGGRRYFPRPWTGMASSQRRPCQPRPAEGDVGDRELPHGGSRRACRTLRGLCLHDHSLQ
jgi:site-specific recombinase XerD